VKRNVMSVLCLLGVMGCSEPITATGWINVDEDSVLSAEFAGQPIEIPLEGGLFAKVRINISRFPIVSGTIDVQQVRLGGQGEPLGDLCARKDPNNSAVGTFRINTLTGHQDIVFPLAVIASSSTLEASGIGEIAVQADASDLQVPLEPWLAEAILFEGTLDDAVELPVVLEGDIEVTPTFVLSAVLDLLLRTSSAPPSAVSDVALVCRDKWELQGRELDHVVNAKGTYLRTLWDHPRSPTIVDLASIGAASGDTLVLRRKGRFKRTGLSWDANRIAGVFSGSDRLRATRYRDRVVDAIDAGYDVSTPRTRWWWKSTDISEDFEIGEATEVEVPHGATHLFVTPIDDYFKDNFSLELRVGVEVQCAGDDCDPPDPCDGIMCDDGKVCTSDACDPLNGQCESTPVADGTACDFGGLPGICQGGLCQDAMLCQGVVCDDGEACTMDACDPLNGQCGNTPVADGTACDFGGLPGLCQAGACEDAMLCQGVVCDDGEACTMDACDPLNGQCGNTPVPNGTACGSGGMCMDGLCMVDPPALTIVQTVNCTPLGVAVSVPVTLTVDAREPFNGGGALVDSVIDVEIDASIGQIVLNLFGNDEVTIGAASVDVAVTGAAPATIAHEVPGTPRVFDVDSDDDGNAEPLVLATNTATTLVTSDGSAQVDFGVTGILVQITGPVILTLDDSNCTVEPGSVSYPSN